MTVAIIDYDSGNLHSAEKAFQRAAHEAGLAIDITVTRDPDIVRNADRIVLPGVGAFAACKAGLSGLDGMIPALEEAVLTKATPFLGICVGMQLMATSGTEFGIETVGLGWIKGRVEAIVPDDKSLKIPHMGWNMIEVHRPHPILPTDDTAASHAYFVHSFHVRPEASADIIAVTQHGGPIVAVIGRDNMVGVQFHPEKSQNYGLDLITKFLKWTP